MNAFTPTTITTMIARHSRAHGREALELESQILAAIPEQQNDVAAKWRLVIEMDVLDEDNGFLGRLIETLIRRDAAAVGAPLPFADGECGIW